ncbi:MAG TPA: hypothetical protein VMU84_20995 [Thermoanaerobaculia bacterium]|nr:hypothetical protein [Thermoanaerobaculia bacterium]
MIRSFACVLIAAALALPARATDDRTTLLAVVCIATDGLCQTQHLVRYEFRDGKFESEEIVYRAKTDEVRFDLGDNSIYRNQYVITNWADVIDFRRGELLHQGDGQFTGIDGDQIIQHVNKNDIEGYFSYDLKTGRYARLQSPGKWALPGLLAPDQTKSAYGDGWSIWLHRLNGTKRLLGAKFFVQGDARSSSRAQPPLFWLDNERILTQRSNGKVVVVRENGKITPIVSIPLGPTLYDPWFFRDANGTLVYECSDKAFAIDVEHKTYARYEWYALGFGFDAAIEQNPSYGYVIRYRGKEIGRVWGLARQAKTASGTIAIVYGDIGSNLGYPKGIRVWSAATGQWTTLENKWTDTIIGWIEP